MHRYVLHNDDIQDAHAGGVSPGQVGFMNGWGVFSTLRVAEGVLFAYERHWDRMRRDAVRMHVPFPDNPEWLRLRLQRLIEANRALNATLRVAIVRNHGGPFEGPDDILVDDLFASSKRLKVGDTVERDQLLRRFVEIQYTRCLLYTSPSPRDRTRSRMPSSA